MTRTKKRAPHKQVMWAITASHYNYIANDNPEGLYFVSESLHPSRRDCINNFIKWIYQDWGTCRRKGYRCVKVEVREIVK